MKKSFFWALALLASFQVLSVEAKTLMYEKATLAGGCFWCMESPFEKLEGVTEVISGFSGGQKKNPSYEEVAGGKTKHRESVQISFDPKKVSYQEILEVYWKQINPTDDQGQFVDRGYQYSPAIYFHNQKQKEIALTSKKDLMQKKVFSKPINVPIEKFKSFYPAEDYHQDYYKKNPVRYHFYRYRSGRDDFLEKYWKK